MELLLLLRFNENLFHENLMVFCRKLKSILFKTTWLVLKQNIMRSKKFTIAVFRKMVIQALFEGKNSTNCVRCEFCRKLVFLRLYLNYRKIAKHRLKLYLEMIDLIVIIFLYFVMRIDFLSNSIYLTSMTMTFRMYRELYFV